MCADGGAYTRGPEDFAYVAPCYNLATQQADVDCL